MRKLIAILLGVAMMLSLVIIGVSADDPATEISSADQFATMAADGNYKLTADITITASYANEFTGSFDGNGKTITLEGAPAFKKLTGATVSNLTLVGNVTGNGHLGALSIEGSNMTITKVTNKASVTASEMGKYVGGLVGSVTTGGGTKDAPKGSTFTDCTNEGAVTGVCGVNSKNENQVCRIGGLVGNAAKYQQNVYTNCVNKGKISTTGESGGSPYVAGIAGSAFGGKFNKCTNYGELYSDRAAHMGGIVGRCSPSCQGGDQSVTCTDCVNNGKLTCANNDATTSGTAGGIIGHAGADDKSTNTKAVYAAVNCVNNGDIICGGTQAGGIIGYVYGIDESETKYQYGRVEGCTNNGNLTGTKTVTQNENGTAFEATFLSQFLGYANTKSNIFKNSKGLGKLTNTNNNYNVIFGMSSNTGCVAGTTVEGLQIKKDDGTVNFNWCADGSALGDRAASRVSLEDYLKIEGNAQKITVVEASTGTTDPGTSAGTGDTAVIVMIVCLVSLLGMGIALKARRA